MMINRVNSSIDHLEYRSMIIVLIVIPIVCSLKPIRSEDVLVYIKKYSLIDVPFYD